MSEFMPDPFPPETIGSYIDNHFERTFQAQERIWVLKNKHLEYKIDAHDKRYTNTLELTDEELEEIIRFIQEKDLLQTVDKELNAQFPFNEGRLIEAIRGSLHLNGHEVEIHFQAEGPDLLEEDIQGGV